MSIDMSVKMPTVITAEKIISIIDLIDDQIENRGKYLTPDPTPQSGISSLRRNSKFTERAYTEFAMYVNPKDISPY